MSAPSMDAAAYYSGAASRFHASYAADANRQERLAVWGRFIDRFVAGASFAYDLGCGSGILACDLARRGIESGRRRRRTRHAVHRPADGKATRG